MLIWIKKEEGWIMEEKGKMARDGGFSLFEKLRFWCIQ